MRPLHITICLCLSSIATAEEIATRNTIATQGYKPVADAVAPAPQANESNLHPGEARIRAGIILQGYLHDTLAKVRDQESAEAATGPIMRFSRELQEWAQGFAALPPLDDETKGLFEEKYLPIIRQMNDRIKAQGERIAAAEFYGSQNLPAALVRLVQAMQ